ncbi:MAG: sugar ABC transporter ATP-binding protein [Pirellulaceae bacterium]
MTQRGGPTPLPLVCMRGITKRFGRVTVLENVDFEVRRGEVHVLAGENGAGKSTLIKILGGVHRDFEGTLAIGGRIVRHAHPREATAMGVAVIHQELSLVPSMSVADNMFLGRPLARFGGLVRDGRQRSEARRLLREFGVDVDVDQAVGDLPVATQQLIEIAKALSQNAKVIVMDEPTSALSAPEVEKLFALIDQLKARGCGIVYITHKMEEIERVADRITVLRDGHFIASSIASELPVHKLIRGMVGREIDQQFPRHTPEIGDERLRIEDFSVTRGDRRVVDNVSFTLRKGEIVGLAGLQGSGCSELLTGLFGALESQADGRVWLDGEPARLTSPRESIRRGVALLTNDRKATGLVLSLSVVANTTLADLTRCCVGGWRLSGRERAAATGMAEALHLRAASLDMEVAELSGGNQQKVAIAKWLLTQPRVLLLDEPTRGVDVGAKREIYDLMNVWTRQGIVVLMVTSEMPELLAMSDRILVMHRGRVTAEFSGKQATADAVLEAAMGKEQEVAQP